MGLKCREGMSSCIAFCLSGHVVWAQAVSAPAMLPGPLPPPDPRLKKGPLYIMAPGSGLLTGGAQLVHQQQVAFLYLLLGPLLCICIVLSMLSRTNILAQHNAE